MKKVLVLAAACVCATNLYAQESPYANKKSLNEVFSQLRPGNQTQTIQLNYAIATHCLAISNSGLADFQLDKQGIAADKKTTVLKAYSSVFGTLLKKSKADLNISDAQSGQEIERLIRESYNPQSMKESGDKQSPATCLEILAKSLKP